MIQPMNTLRDHPNVFTDEEKVSRKGINEAYEGIRQALKSSRVSLNDILIDQPEAPELDQSRIAQNRKMGRMGAALQALDSIATMATHRGTGSTPMVNTGRFDELGLSAMNNLVEMDNQHQINLRNYNVTKDQVTQANKELAMNVHKHNAGLGLQAAQIGLQQEEGNYAALLRDEERKRLDSDKEAAALTDMALRMVSQGQIGMGVEYFKNAGFSNDRIDEMITEARQAQVHGQGGYAGHEQGGMPGQFNEFGLTQRDMILYNQLQSVQSRINPETDYQKMLDGTGAFVPDYSKPIPGTPAADFAAIQKELGGNLYLINGLMQSEHPGGYGPEQRRQSIDNQNTEKVQQGRFNSLRTQQQVLLDGYRNPVNQEQKERSKQVWFHNNAQILKNLGYSDEEIPEMNEDIFREVTGEQEPESEVQTATESTNNEISEIDQDYKDFQQSGVQIQARQNQQLTKKFGNDWQRVMELLREDRPNASDDFLKYLMLKDDFEDTESQDSNSRNMRYSPTIQDVARDVSGAVRDHFDEKHGSANANEIIQNQVNTARQRLERLRRNNASAGIIRDAERKLEEQIALLNRSTDSQLANN